MIRIRLIGCCLVTRVTVVARVAPAERRLPYLAIISLILREVGLGA